MRILQWAFPHQLPLGGREIFTERLSRAFVARGHEVLLMADSITKDSPLHVVEDLGSGIELHRLNLSSFGKPASIDGSAQNLRGEIKKVIDAFQPDVIHYHNFYSESLIFLSAYMRSTSRKIPVVYTLHDIDTLSKIPPALGGEVIGRLTDVIVSPSKYIHDRFMSIDTIKSKNAVIIHNGVPAIDVQAKSDELQVLAAASFESHKGLIILLTAWAKIQSQFPSAALVIAGDGRERNFLLDYAQKLGVDSRVTFPGWLSEEQLRSEFAKDTIVVAPSLIAEAFGLIVAEGQMAGLPAIASDIGGLKEIVVNNESGFLVPPGSSDALAKAITRLLEDSTLRRKMGNRGRELALGQFDLEVCATRYLDLFESLHA